MKKALLLKASPRAGWSDGAAETLAEILAEKGVEVRTAAVREEEIGYCRGCGACMGRGEESCPMSGDGAQRLLSEMLCADGVVILTPNYALQVPALLKNLLDRLSFVFHRRDSSGASSCRLSRRGYTAAGAFISILTIRWSSGASDP